jgi:CO dehydrogenase/acetyl-CoA synthase beta subunit
MTNYFIQADIAHERIVQMLKELKEAYPELQIWKDIVFWDASELDAEIIGG